jgi:glycosyltransferase involved in cell wall biosynthesis
MVAKRSLRIEGIHVQRTHPIRVLLTVPHLSSTASPYRETMSVARRLPRDGFSLTICSLRTSGYAEAASLLREIGVPVFVARFRPRGYSAPQIMQCLRDQAVIARHGPFDVQHSLDFSSSPLEAAMARLHGRRFVFSQRNLGVNTNRNALRIKVRCAHGIVALTGVVRDMLVAHGAPSHAIRVIYNGLSIPCDSLAADRPRDCVEPLRVLSVGHIVRLKRQADAIRAIAAVAHEVPNVQLDIVGAVFDEQYDKELHRLVDELGLASSSGICGATVRFLGEQSNVIDLMRRSDVLLHCSESEALPWVLLEAMSVGVPVVATNAAGSEEIVEHGTGHIVKIGDIAALERALREVLLDRDSARHMAVNARTMIVQRFNESAMMKQHADFYREVCADVAVSKPTCSMRF